MEYYQGAIIVSYTNGHFFFVVLNNQTHFCFDQEHLQNCTHFPIHSNFSALAKWSTSSLPCHYGAGGDTF